VTLIPISYSIANFRNQFACRTVVFVRLGISIHESNTMTRFDMYQQVRKINPQLYWHPDTQKQMKQDARRMGDAFFKQIEMHFGEVQP